MSEGIARAKATAKQMAAVLKGETGIYSLLARDHGEIESLLRQALQTSSSSQRAPLLAKARILLRAHVKAKESSLYQRLAEFPEAREVIQRCRSDCGAMEELFQEVAVCETGSEEAAAALVRLRELAARHSQYEEDELFYLAHSLLSKDQESKAAEAYGREKQAEKARLKGEGGDETVGPVVL